MQVGVDSRRARRYQDEDLKRVLLAGALALVTLQGVQIVASIVPSACADGCVDGSGDDETCPPLCDECVCCPAIRAVASATEILARAPDVRLDVARPAPRAPGDAEPGEILHVPKSA